jgi:hypothetical protein
MNVKYFFAIICLGFGVAFSTVATFVIFAVAVDAERRLISISTSPPTSVYATVRKWLCRHYASLSRRF